MSEPLVISVGTTHPLNVAGVGRDVRVAADFGVRHAMAVAAVSAQNEAGVQQLHVVPAAMLEAQLRSLPLNARAIRVGALGSAANVRAAADYLHEYYDELPIVIDPVMRASSGGSLYDDDPIDALKYFLHRCDRSIVTPNIGEAEQFTGMQIADALALARAGSAFVELGADAALVKGGHLSGDPVDVLVTRDGVTGFEGSRIDAVSRGTGCALAMAMACELAHGTDLVAAVKGAREYVRANIARA